MPPKAPPLLPAFFCPCCAAGPLQLSQPSSPGLSANSQPDIRPLQDPPSKLGSSFLLPSPCIVAQSLCLACTCQSFLFWWNSDLPMVRGPLSSPHSMWVWLPLCPILAVRPHPQADACSPYSRTPCLSHRLLVRTFVLFSWQGPPAPSWLRGRHFLL